MHQSLLHQALERRTSVADLGEAAWRIREVGKEFLILVDGLIVLAAAFVDLAEVIVGEDRRRGKTWQPLMKK